MLIAWGAAATLMGAIQGVAEFHVLRVLLGIAEAGFFPGIILYLSFWFPNADRGRAIGALAVGLPAANLLGAPLSSWILRHNWFDIAGWRWLFVLEGLPSVVAGVLTLLYLADGPAQASWLSRQELETLERVKASQRPMRTQNLAANLGRVDYVLPLLVLAWFLDNMGVYGFNLWLPSMLHRASGYSSATVVAISSLPFVGAAVAAAFVSLSTDRTGERRWHTAAPLITFGVGLAMSVTFSQNLWVSLGWLSLGALGLTSGTPGFWAIATALPGGSPSKRIALITSAGALGGFCGPYLMGYLRKRTDSFDAGLLWLAFAVTLAGGLVLIASRRSRAGG